LGTSSGTGLQANAEKTKYTFMPREQNAGQNHNIKTGDKSSESMAKFKYLGTLANQNCIHEEIKSRLDPGNDRNHSIQNRLSSRFISKKY
jgi:hypothetical protein